MSRSNDLHVIIGLGATGISVLRFLRQKNIPVAINDTRVSPPQMDQFTSEFPDVPVSLGKLDDQLLDKAAALVISPGISIQQPAIARQIARGTPILGDIELFAQATDKPVIAITGTNAKSTVTTLVGEMMKQAGYTVGVGGNLGTPALDLLSIPNAQGFVLELSSFQLETTQSLEPAVATILNVTPDHMDRYATLEEYWAAKYRIYSNCAVAVCNRDDTKTECEESRCQRKFHFTLDTPGENEFGLITHKGQNHLAFQDQLLLPVKDLPVLGKHYQANALASLAIGHGFGLPFEPMLKTLTEFKGLPHRCQLVRERQGVRWYNDSKGTNVGATIAAIEGLGSEIQGKLVLIAGGVGKNADFSPLIPAVMKYVKSAVLIGEAAHILANILGDRVETHFAKSMQDAVNLASGLAAPGDSVLLSPACASFDMFNNFEHRGTVFADSVRSL